MNSTSINKKNHFYVVFVLAISIVFFFNSCKKEKEQGPCEKINPVTANFTIEEVMKDGNNYKYPMGNDSINGGGYIRFTAQEDGADEYKWLIGNEPSFRFGKQLHILFENAYGEINIKLIVTKKSVIECFPNAKVVDTVYKSIWIHPYDTTILFGTYVGHIDNRQEEDTVKLYTYNSGLRISGLAESCSPLQQQIDYTTTYQFYLGERGTLCAVYKGYGVFDKTTKKLTVTYTEQDRNANLIDRTFIGFKIN